MIRLVRLEAGTGSIPPPGVAESLRAGGMVVFPTDTLYGLGVDPSSGQALARLLAVKGREAGKPIPLLLDVPARASSLARRIPAEASRLMERFWPGALTIVLPAKHSLPDAVTGGTGTVGLRVPAHPVPRALAAAAGGAITGTSANRAGRQGIWRTAEEIVAEFSGEADWVLWEGPAAPSPGSTVVQVGEGKISLLREGAIPFPTITEALGEG